MGQLPNREVGLQLGNKCKAKLRSEGPLYKLFFPSGSSQIAAIIRAITSRGAPGMKIEKKERGKMKMSAHPAYLVFSVRSHNHKRELLRKVQSRSAV